MLSIETELAYFPAIDFKFNFVILQRAHFFAADNETSLYPLMETFKSIAGTTDADDDKVQRLIDFYNNDVNNALAHYFEQGFEGLTLGIDAHPSHGGLHHRGHNSTPQTPLPPPRQDFRQEAINLHQQMFNDGLMRLPRAPTVGNQWQLEVGLHRLRLEHAVSEKTEDMGPQGSFSLWVLLLIIPRSLASFFIWLWQLVTPKEPPNRFRGQYNFKHYDESYDPELPQGLSVATCDFDPSLKHCQQRYEWMVLVLVNNDTEWFGLKIIESDWFAEMFGSEGLFAPARVYFGNVDASPEAHAVAGAYGCRRLPFVAMAANVSASPSVMASMSVVYKLNVAQALLEEPQNTLRRIGRNMHKVGDIYNAQLVSSRFDLREIEYARVLKQQQDQAYEDSLQQDRIKKQQREERVQRQQQQLSLARQKRTFLRFAQTWKDGITEGTNRMAIKMPSGGRQVVKLPGDLTVQHLYLWIELLMKDEETEDDDYDDQPLTFEEYFDKFEFNFEVVQPFPKEVIVASGRPIAEVPALKSGANLLVEYLEDEEEEE